MANIKDVRNLGVDVQQASSFEVIISNDIARFGLDNDITLYAQGVQLPEQSIEQIALHHKGIPSHYRGRDATSHTFTISFFETERMEAYQYFKHWFDILLQNIVSGGGLNKMIYTATVRIVTQRSDEKTNTADWRFHDAFPIELGSVDLSYGNDDALKFDVVFSFDGGMFESMNVGKEGIL